MGKLAPVMVLNTTRWPIPNPFHIIVLNAHAYVAKSRNFKLVVKVPVGVTLTAVLDCCSSGTILDLPYSINAGQTITGVKDFSVKKVSRNSIPDS